MIFCIHSPTSANWGFQFYIITRKGCNEHILAPVCKSFFRDYAKMKNCRVREGASPTLLETANLPLEWSCQFILSPMHTSNTDFLFPYIVTRAGFISLQTSPIWWEWQLPCFYFELPYYQWDWTSLHTSISYVSFELCEIIFFTHFLGPIVNHATIC